MSFLDINGLAVDVEMDSLQRDYKDIQTFERSEGFSYEGALFASKREWTFTIPWKPTEAEAISTRDWLKGRGHYWTFQRVDGATTRYNRFPADGGPAFDTGLSTNGTCRFLTTSPNTALWGMQVNTGLTCTVTVTFGNDGRYSVSLWKLDNLASPTSWVLCSNVFDGTTSRFFAPGSSLTTSFAWATITAASGYLSVSLLGKNQAGTNGTAAYDKLWIVPYALSTPMLEARQARTSSALFEPVFPFVEMDGDCLEDLYPVTVKAFVDSEDMTQVAQSGLKNARMLKVRLVEK